MKPRLSPSPRLFGLLGAILPLAGFVIALAMTLVQPVPDWARPPAEEAAPPPVDPTYLEMDRPLRFGVMGGRIQISMSLGFAARVAGLDLLDLGTRVQQRQDAILARLTDAAIEAAARERDSRDLASRLRAALPGPMRQIVNEALATETLPEPVEEVLILDLSIQGG